MNKIIILIVTFFSINIYSQEIETENWITDLNFLKTELPKKHKNLFFKMSKNEFEKGTKGICRRIWPKLAYIATVTGANFSIYDDKVNYYTDSLPIYSTAYAATEAMIAIRITARTAITMMLFFSAPLFFFSGSLFF